MKGNKKSSMYSVKQRYNKNLEKKMQNFNKDKPIAPPIYYSKEADENYNLIVHQEFLRMMQIPLWIK